MRHSRFLLFAVTLALGGCGAVVLDPSGDVAAQQRDLLLSSAGLMLLIILPVMALSALFAWHYRQSNQTARYEPDWDHSTQLELVIWGAPLLIIICLGALTWMGAHLLDPYRPLGRINASQPVAASEAKPLEIDVVALDWKWLFIYPEYGVAAVNVAAVPVDRPIAFKLSASSVMNSFFVPALAGQIYAMPGMQTRLHAVINHAGEYDGFSANYSGAGFSGMRFRFRGLDGKGFDEWIAQARRDGGDLTRQEYLALERPSQNVKPHTYARVDTDLFDAVVNMCVEPGKMCQRDMMAIDARGGLGLAGLSDPSVLDYDKSIRRGGLASAGLCALPEPGDEPASQSPALRADGSPLRGAGLKVPVGLPLRLRWPGLFGPSTNS